METTTLIAWYKDNKWAVEGRNGNAPWVASVVIVVLCLTGLELPAVALAFCTMWRRHFELGPSLRIQKVIMQLEERDDFDPAELEKPMTSAEKQTVEIMRNLING